MKAVEGYWNVQTGGSYLVKCCHACHVDPVEINVYTGSPEHVHDGVSIALLDMILENDLVGEPHSSLARIEPGEHTGPS